MEGFEKSARKELITHLKENRDNISYLIEDGKDDITYDFYDQSNSEVLINELCKLDDFRINKNYGAAAFDLDLIQEDRDTIKLEIKRDSKTKNEYWVYSYQYDNNGTHVGNIRTSIFDGIDGFDFETILRKALRKH